MTQFSEYDNPCSFQDRVSEFARMTPQQLLRETQRAAGDENLTGWHDPLIEAGKQLRELQAVSCLFPFVFSIHYFRRLSKSRKTPRSK